MITIYTDGSTCKNGRKDASGGFGVVVLESWDGVEETATVIDAKQEHTEGTTNNREEMKAVIWALEHYGDKAHRGNGFLIPIVYCDSMYCVNSFTNWIKGWKANGWVRAGGKKLENLDLIQRYDELLEQGYLIDLRWVAGHRGNEWNELADALATGKTTVDAVLNKCPGQERENELLQELD